MTDQERIEYLEQELEQLKCKHVGLQIHSRNLEDKLKKANEEHKKLSDLYCSIEVLPKHFDGHVHVTYTFSSRHFFLLKPETRQVMWADAFKRATDELMRSLSPL